MYSGRKNNPPNRTLYEWSLVIEEMRTHLHDARLDLDLVRRTNTDARAARARRRVERVRRRRLLLHVCAAACALRLGLRRRRARLQSRAEREVRAAAERVRQAILHRLRGERDVFAAKQLYRVKVTYCKLNLLVLC